MHFQNDIRTLLVAGVSLLALTVAAAAADLSTESRIDAVTVFPNSASVTRLARVTPEQGDHVVYLKGLPPRIDPNSITVKAVAPFGIEIGSVDLKRVNPAPLPLAERTKTERRIAELQGDRVEADDAIAVARERIKFVEGLATSLGNQLPSADNGTRIDMAGIKDAAAFSVTERQSAQMDIRKSEAFIRDIDIEIEQLRKTLEGENASAAPTMQIAIALTSAGAGAAEFSVEYRLPDARWTPVYEARLETGSANTKPSLAFVTRAAISQKTGEDWSNVKLTLSTTRPSRGTGVGTLPVPTANFFDPRPPMPVGLAAPAPMVSEAAKPIAPGRFKLADDARAPEETPPEAEAPKPQSATERLASIDTNGTTVVYTIPGTVQVPSGADVKTLKVTSEQIEPQILERIVPKLAPAAYLTAAFARTAEGALLPGTVGIFRDGVYVGQSSIGQTGSGETIKLGFGEDERIKVTYAPLRQQDGETGTFTTSKIQKRDARVSITNNAALPVSVIVEDQMPVSENTDIKIEPLSTNTQPQQTGLDGRRGSVAWTFDLKAKEQKEIRFGWQAKWPADKSLRWINVAK
jgi:uncharacterized protein (TIGR02231 family)